MKKIFIIVVFLLVGLTAKDTFAYVHWSWYQYSDAKGAWSYGTSNSNGMAKFELHVKYVSPNNVMYHKMYLWIENTSWIVVMSHIGGGVDIDGSNGSGYSDVAELYHEQKKYFKGSASKTKDDRLGNRAMYSDWVGYCTAGQNDGCDQSTSGGGWIFYD